MPLRILPLPSILPMNSAFRGPAVLVVDDNRDVADALAAVLETAGYQASAFVSVRDALDVLDADPTIGTVISDVRMPDLDGFDFLRVVKHRFPQMRVFLVTGQEVTSHDVVPQGAVILKKPVEHEELLRLMRAEA